MVDTVRLAAQGHDLTSCNTLALVSQAPVLRRLRSAEELPELLDGLPPGRPLFVLGGGSNIVLAPVVRSPVIKVETRGRRLLEETSRHRIVEVAAGESWHALVAWCVEQGWGGLENLALIPGTVGAAPVQNIGAYGVELDQRLHSLVAWDLQTRTRLELGPADCGFSYRDSLFKQAGPGRWLITQVRLCLPKVWEPVLHYPDLRDWPGLADAAEASGPGAVFAAVCAVRRRKLPDPERLPNAGSFFKNPVVDDAHYRRIRARWPDVVAYAQPDGFWKLAAGWMIERSGWKGRRLGPVGMHQHQALVLVNHGRATADDVMALAGRIRADVAQRFDVELEQEPVAVA